MKTQNTYLMRFISVGFIAAVGVANHACADALYAAYSGSQLGVTIRDVNTLNQYVYLNTGISASGISVDSNNNIYTASANHLRKYDLSGALQVDMTFPDSAINYTDVVVSGNNVYASYTGSQQGFTIRDSQSLNQNSYCSTGINASGIAVDSKGDVYLAAGNNLRKYSPGCKLIANMTFLDASINYTDITVIGNTVYASYTGSQLGNTTRSANNLSQSAYCSTGISARSIAVDSSNNIYMAAGNHLYKYAANCRRLVDMTFPDSRINYTSVYVK